MCKLSLFSEAKASKVSSFTFVWGEKWLLLVSLFETCIHELVEKVCKKPQGGYGNEQRTTCWV